MVFDEKDVNAKFKIHLLWLAALECKCDLNSFNGTTLYYTTGNPIVFLNLCLRKPPPISSDKEK